MKNLKKFSDLSENSVNEANGKKVWIGILPEAFGYGLSAVGESKKEVEDALRKGYQDFMTGANNDVEPHMNTFKKAMEYFGGRIDEVEMGKAYYDNFGE